jgi:AcrR family transcriptional regulator
MMKEVVMSPSFSEAERERIRGLLLDAGRELFSTRGLRKTSMEDLTRPAGIHKTTFYSFFGSKEELYLELLGLEGPGVRERVNKALGGAADGPREALRRFLRAVVDELETNPLVRRLVTHPEELEMVASRARPEDLEAKAAALLPVREFVEEGQREGWIVSGNPEAIVGAIRAVTMLTLHRRDIGEEVYPEVLETIISLVADGLTRVGGADAEAKT